MALAVVAVLAIGAAIFGAVKAFAPTPPKPVATPSSTTPATTPEGQSTQPMRGQ